MLQQGSWGLQQMYASLSSSRQVYHHHHHHHHQLHRFAFCQAQSTSSVHRCLCTDLQDAPVKHQIAELRSLKPCCNPQTCTVDRGTNRAVSMPHAGVVRQVWSAHAPREPSAPAGSAEMRHGAGHATSSRRAALHLTIPATDSHPD